MFGPNSLAHPIELGPEWFDKRGPLHQLLGARHARTTAGDGAHWRRLGIQLQAIDEFMDGGDSLHDRLTKLGLEAIKTEGETFDPNLHQAVERVESSDAPDQTIVGEFQRGYRFKGRLLRPSMVRVAVHS